MTNIERYYDSVSRQDAIVAATVRGLGEISEDITDGVIPRPFFQFSELHQFTDANKYGGFCDPDNPACADFDFVERVQHQIEYLWRLERFTDIMSNQFNVWSARPGEEKAGFHVHVEGQPQSQHLSYPFFIENGIMGGRAWSGYEPAIGLAEQQIHGITAEQAAWLAEPLAYGVNEGLGLMMPDGGVFEGVEQETSYASKKETTYHYNPPLLYFLHDEGELLYLRREYRIDFANKEERFYDVVTNSTISHGFNNVASDQPRYQVLDRYLPMDENGMLVPGALYIHGDTLQNCIAGQGSQVHLDMDDDGGRGKVYVNCRHVGDLDFCDENVVYVTYPNGHYCHACRYGEHPDHQKGMCVSCYAKWCESWAGR